MQKERRLEAYRRVLARHPGYLEAAMQAEESLRKASREGELPTDTRLYLYAMAPALSEFVGWVLEEAVKAGKRKLYFLSRDGYPMYRTAQRLCQARGYGLECRYLNVSRYSMRVPGYHLQPDHGLEWICVGGIDVTLEKILRRAALTDQEMKEAILAMGWQGRCQEILNYRQISELKGILGGQPKLLRDIDRHSREAYPAALGYLRQEGLLSEEPYALVDSGWVGTLQQSLERLVHSSNPGIRVEGYYFGLYELPRNADVSAYHAWYFTPGTGLGRKARFSNSLFEAVCSAGEGMTLGYRRDEKSGKYQPVRETSGNPNRDQLRRNEEALEKFLECCGNVPAIDGLSQGEAAKPLNLRGKGHDLWRQGDPAGTGVKLARKLFDLLMAGPTNLEVTAYGDTLFCDDILESGRRKTAAELTEEQIRDQRLLGRFWILTGRKKKEIRESAWIEGSIVRCGSGNIRSSLRHVRCYKYLVFARKQFLTGKT